MPSAADTQRDAKPIPDQVTIRGNAAALVQAAETLGGKRVQSGVRAFVIPDDAQAYAEAIDNGAIAALHEAGFVICNPGTPDPALAQGEISMRAPGNAVAEIINAVLA